MQFFEFSWLFWWFLAIVAILRWLHINRLPYDSSPGDETTDVQGFSKPVRSARSTLSRQTPQ
jgi:hypothetical protein